MALKIVSNAATVESGSVADLLVDPESTPNPARVADAAEKERVGILAGLAVFGDALAAAVHSEIGIDKSDVAQGAFFIARLAALADRLADIQVAAMARVSTGSREEVK